MMRPSDYVLSPNEMRLIEAYRNGSLEERAYMLRFAENFFQDRLCKASAPGRPALKLIHDAGRLPIKVKRPKIKQGAT